MAKDKTANEHYVPQAYLKSFTNKNNQCFVYDKKNNNSFCSNIKNILAKRYLYDFDSELLKSFPKVDQQAVEKILANTIDGYWGNIVSNIEKNFEWFSLKHSWNFLDVYRCTAVQLMRTPNGKETLLKIYNTVYEKEHDKKFENIVLAKEILDVLNENMRSALLEILLNEFGHLTIGINHTEIPFITSDTPVFVLPNKWDEGKTEMMYYPITPKRCIFFFKRKYPNNQLKFVLEDIKSGKFMVKDFSDIPQEAYRREQEILKKLNPESITLNPEEVLLYNSYCVEIATQYIISNQDMTERKFWV